MDELSKLKSSWAKQKFAQQYTKEEINQFLTKKSKSSIRWIFYFSIAEFILYLSFPFLVPNYFELLQYYHDLNLYSFAVFVTLIGYVLLLYFVIRFFQHYRSISVSDSIKGHLTAILKTRRSVNNYILINLGIIFIFILVVLFVSLEHNQKLNELLTKPLSLLLTFIVSVIVIGVFVAIIGLFYYLIYGRFLASLKQNEKELKEVDYTP